MPVSREWQEMLANLPPVLRRAILERKAAAGGNSPDADSLTMEDLQALERELGGEAHNKLTVQ